MIATGSKLAPGLSARPQTLYTLISFLFMRRKRCNEISVTPCEMPDYNQLGLCVKALPAQRADIGLKYAKGF